VERGHHQLCISVAIRKGNKPATFACATSDENVLLLALTDAHQNVVLKIEEVRRQQQILARILLGNSEPGTCSMQLKLSPTAIHEPPSEKAIEGSRGRLQWWHLKRIHQRLPQSFEEE
jgi:hypothetical protein